jgi:hypothetical protein
MTPEERTELLSALERVPSAPATPVFTSSDTAYFADIAKWRVSFARHADGTIVVIAIERLPADRAKQVDSIFKSMVTEVGSAKAT